MAISSVDWIGSPRLSGCHPEAIYSMTFPASFQPMLYWAIPEITLSMTANCDCISSHLWSPESPAGVWWCWHPLLHALVIPGMSTALWPPTPILATTLVQLSYGILWAWKQCASPTGLLLAIQFKTIITTCSVLGTMLGTGENLWREKPPSWEKFIPSFSTNSLLAYCVPDSILVAEKYIH